MNEEKIYQMAYNWAVHVWYEADLELSKCTDSNYLKDEEQEAWENLMAIEQIAKEKGYTL